MTGKVLVYMSSVAGTSEMRGHLQRVRMVLESKKIKFEEVDISADDESKETMRQLANDPKAIPPQFAYEDESGNKEYLGDYEAFDEAVEMEELSKFCRQDS